LVKINSDDEQQLSQAFGIRSIPTCVLMHRRQACRWFHGCFRPKVRRVNLWTSTCQARVS
jgi:thioredoxin-like negative regulator of GroEL